MRRAVPVVSALLWAGSWRVMYLEVTRWHHVKPNLAFNSDPIPGTDIRPHPGIPLLLVYATSALAPVVTVVSAYRLRRAR